MSRPFSPSSPVPQAPMVPRCPSLASITRGAGADLVLLHGGVGSWTHWLRNLPELARHYRVRAFDLPGFGASPDFPEGLDDSAYFQWVAEAILAESRGPIRLVGFSFGGSVAAPVAALLGKRLAALTLVAPGGFGVPTERNVTVKPLRARKGVSIDERAAARHNLSQVMLADPANVDEATIDLHLRNVARARFNSRRVSWQDRLQADLAPLCSPLQMIWGAQDRMATPSVEARAERCRRVRPGIRFDLIPQSGHWVQYERPAAFNAAVLEFLEEHPQPSHRSVT